MVELLLLAAALSADNFAVSIGYGSSNTRISPGMTALLNLFCSAALVASAQFGKRFLQSAGPEWGTRVGAGNKKQRTPLAKYNVLSESFCACFCEMIFCQLCPNF